MNSKVERRLSQPCGIKDCARFAVGKVWSDKQVGLPLGHPILVCQVHLELIRGEEPLRISIYQEKPKSDRR